VLNSPRLSGKLDYGIPKCPFAFEEFMIVRDGPIDDPARAEVGVMMVRGLRSKECGIIRVLSSRRRAGGQLFGMTLEGAGHDTVVCHSV